MVASGRQSQPLHDSSQGRESALRAWVGVALFPVFLFGSVIVTLLLYEAFGYKPENADAPLWVDSLIGLVAIAICLLPCAAAVFYGRQAYLAGYRSGLIALAVGALAGLSVTALTVVSTLGPF